LRNEETTEQWVETSLLAILSDLREKF